MRILLETKYQCFLCEISWKNIKYYLEQLIKVSHSQITYKILINEKYKFIIITMDSVLSQSLISIKFDQEIYNLLQKQSEADTILHKIHDILKMEFQNGLQEFQHENRNLNQLIRAIQEENKLQVFQLNEQNNQIEELQNTLLDIEDKLNLMQKDVVSQKEQLINEYEFNLDSLQQKYEAQIQNNNDLNYRKIKDMEIIIEDLQQSLSKANQQIVVYDKDIKNYKKQILSQSDTVDQHKLQLSQQKKQYDQLKVDKSCLEQRTKDQKSQNESQQKHIKLLEGKLINLQEDQEKQNRKFQVETQKLKENFKEQEKIYKKKLSNLILQSRDTAQQLKQAFQKITSNFKLEVNTLRISIAKDVGIAVQGLLQLLQTKMMKYVETYQQQQKIANENTIQVYEEKFDDLRLQLQNHFKQNRDRFLLENQAKIEEINNENSILIINLQSQLDEIEGINENLELQIQLLSDKNKDHNDQIQDKLLIINNQQQLITELSEQVQYLEKQVINYQEQIQILQFENNKNLNQIRILDECLIKTQKQLTYNDDKLIKKQQDELQQQNSYLRKQIQILQEMQQKDQDYIAKLKNNMNNNRVSTIQDVEEKHLMRLQNIQKHCKRNALLTARNWKNVELSFQNFLESNQGIILIQQYRKQNKFIAIEGFRSAFAENIALADKLFKFIKSQSDGIVDCQTLVLSMELLTKPKSEIYIQSFNYKQLEQYQLLLLISISNPDILKREEFKNAQLTKLEISYLQAGIFIKEIINMMSLKGKKLSCEDDVAAKLLTNNIFGDKSNLDFQSFCNAIHAEVPLINTVIRRYFAGKFTSSSAKLKLPEIQEESKLINHQILGLFYLSTPWFYQTKSLNQIYLYQEGLIQYDFEMLVNALTSARGPTLMLFRHVERLNKHEKLPYQHTIDENLDAFEKFYHFGFYCSTSWRHAPDITGDKNCSIFSIVPKYQQFVTSRGKGQAKFALLNSEQGKPLTGTIAQRLKRFGLGLGGTGIDKHRIWLDSADIKESYITDEDKTYLSGHILAPHIKSLVIDRIEIWALELLAPAQDMSFFRQTQKNHINKLLNEEEKVYSQQHPTDVLESIRNQQTSVIN
ncbi:hypothetical protein pb186bvf_020395 [Paramecium bursaria]